MKLNQNEFNDKNIYLDNITEKINSIIEEKLGKVVLRQKQQKENLKKHILLLLALNF